MPQNPVINSSLVPAAVPVQNAAQRVLVVAQRGIGTVTDESLQENIGNDGEETALFGVTGAVTKMLTAFKLSNPVSQVDAIGLDPGATPRVHTITVTGTATAAGTILLIVGSRKNHLLTIPVGVASDANTIAAAIRAAVNADTGNPFVATGATSAVILTAPTAGGGTAANAYPIGFTGTLSQPDWRERLAEAERDSKAGKGLDLVAFKAGKARSGKKG